MPSAVEFRPTIDRRWLEAAAARAPLDHAYAVWDLDRFPAVVDGWSAVHDGLTVGYALVWNGHPAFRVVHWFGAGPWADQLAERLPARPLVAIVPPDAREPVLGARGPGREFPELLQFRPPDPLAAPRGTAPGVVRPLTAADGPTVQRWARRQRAAETNEYPGLDLTSERAWGAFDGDALVGVARAAIRLPTLWVIAGVFVDPIARGRGFGTGLVRAVVGAAADAKAATGLFVREDRSPARRLYSELGFRVVGERRWLDLGAGAEP